MFKFLLTWWGYLSFKILFSMAIAEREYAFVHHDMHARNILWRTVPVDWSKYRVLDSSPWVYEVNTHGIEPVIIDFGLTSLIVKVQPPGAPHGSPPILARFSDSPATADPFSSAELTSTKLISNMDKGFSKLVKAVKAEVEDARGALPNETYSIWIDETQRPPGNNKTKAWHDHPDEFANFPGGCGDCQCYLKSEHFRNRVWRYLENKGVVRRGAI